ncbi:MAG: helix-turn-helix transcriptional regulator [Clostridia bacterium]|nr:helix-turn-helix transcriptional regulator [Clostridia bacterium]
MYLLDIANANFEKDHFTAKRHTDVSCPLHLHYAMEIVCVTCGAVRMVVNEETREIRAGECTLILPFEAHSFETPCASECFVLVFSPELIPDVYETVRDKTLAIPTCPLSPAVLALCDGKLPDDIDATDSIRIRALLYPLLAEILAGCAFVPAKRQYEGTVFLDAVRYISRNFRTKDVSLSATAAALGIHHVYLSRVFKESCGIQYTKYINSVRASYAARLLREQPAKSISEIAYDAGFGSIRNFNREFKALYGVCPEEFLIATHATN